jgi:hypothetical protein
VQRRNKCSGKRNDSSMQTETPVGIRERSNPRSNPHDQNRWVA